MSTFADVVVERRRGRHCRRTRVRW